MSRTVRVLVVDGSAVARRELAGVLDADPSLCVVACVGSGHAALEYLDARKAAASFPDILLMDIHVRGADGYETTRGIMETVPLPIVLCSAPDDPQDVASTFRALEAGALAVVAKPEPGSADFESRAAEMRRMVRLMAEVKVVRRWPRRRSTPVVAPASRANVRAVGIGASTGGPPALQTVLGALPGDFPLPILVVQHITSGFLPGLAEWLGQTTPLDVHIAVHGMEPCAGHVYLAPDDFHLELDAEGRVRLTRESPENALRPSVDRLFRSLAQRCGPDGIGVLLTGMGRDGAHELRTMFDHGAHTIAQDRASSVVHGMPGAAIALGAAREVLPIERIADALCRAAARTRNEVLP